MTAKEGKYFTNNPQGKKSSRKRESPWTFTIPFNLSIVSELWLVLFPLKYHIRYALYGSWSGGRLDKDTLWEHNTGVCRYHKRNFITLIELGGWDHH